MMKQIFGVLLGVGLVFCNLMLPAEAVSAPRAKSGAAASSLVGTWKLVSFELRTDDGHVVYPWGRDVSGQVIYTPDGYMSGSFMKGNRAPFQSADVTAGSPAEVDAAMKSYVGYAGPYSVQGTQLTHHASISWFPNWTGTDIERNLAVEGNQLTLSTPPAVFGGLRASAVLVWEKLPPYTKRKK